jgi:hypothetical protein
MCPTKLQIEPEQSMPSSKIRPTNFATPYLAGFYENNKLRKLFSKNDN